VLLAIVQVVFCGALLSLAGVLVLEQAAWLVPARWGFAAMAGTIDLPALSPGDLTSDPLFSHRTGAWLRSVGMLLVLSLVFGLLVSRLLRRQEPVVMRK